MMTRSPGVTGIAVLALALGIGANTAIFSVVNTVLLRPLPYYKDADRLVQIWGTNPSRGIPYHTVTYSDVVDWRAGSQSFEAMAACMPATANLTDGEQPERVPFSRVNADFLPMVGVPMLHGRGFLPDEDKPGGAPVVVLSHGLWQRRFGSDPKVIGRTITLDGAGHTVVGVLPAGFGLAGRQTDIFAPIALNNVRERQNNVSVIVYARLKPGVPIERAQAELDAIGRRILDQNPGSPGGHPRAWRLRDFAVRDVRLSLLVLLAAVALVLLIACANVANLLLARAGARQREIAVRTALGAGKSRIVRQLLTESAVLSLAGGALGILMAYWGVRGLVRISPERYPFLRDTSIDLPVLGFTVVISLLTGLIFGLAPALAAVRTGGLREALKDGGRGSSESFSRNRLRSLVVIGEVALALVLLIGAGLMIRSFARLQGINPGFSPKGVLTASISLPQVGYGTAAQRLAFIRRFLQNLESTPGVQAAGIVSSLPLTGHNNGIGLYFEGRPFPRRGEAPIVWFRTVSSGYFRAMGIPLRKGRLFTEQDSGGPPVAVINEAMARKFWPNEDPVGKRVTPGPPPAGQPITWITVVGVIGDLRHKELSEEPDVEIFWPYQQHAPGNMHITVRTAASPTSFAPQLRAAVASVDKAQPVSQVRAMDQIVADSLMTQRFSVTLMGMFAAVALVLAAVGIYGVISFSVARRTQEIGIRVALGAERGHVVRMVVGHAVALAGAGVAVGLAAAFVLTRVIGSLLYGVSATDPLVFAGVSLLLTAIAALASYVPALRAARVDPIVALRYE